MPRPVSLMPQKWTYVNIIMKQFTITSDVTQFLFLIETLYLILYTDHANGILMPDIVNKDGSKLFLLCCFNFLSLTNS